MGAELDRETEDFCVEFDREVEGRLPEPDRDVEDFGAKLERVVGARAAGLCGDEGAETRGCAGARVAAVGWELGRGAKLDLLSVATLGRVVRCTLVVRCCEV